MDNELIGILGEFNALHGTGFKTAAEMVAYKQDGTKKQQHPAVIQQGYRPGLVTITQDECKALCNEYGVEYKDGFEQRIISQIISTETTDRGGDIVRQHGIDYTNYRGNPQVLYGHMRMFSKFETPVGKSVKILRKTVDGILRTVSWGLFMDNEVDPSGQSDLVFRMSVGGFLPAASIGFIPQKVNNPGDQKERNRLKLGKYGVEFQKSELLEWSKVVLPMNQEALQNQIKAMGDGIKQLRVEDIDLMKTMKVFDDENLLNVTEDAIKGRLMNKTLSIQPIKLVETSGGQEGNDDMNKIKCGNCEKEFEIGKACQVTVNDGGEADSWECPECKAIVDDKGIVPDIIIIDNPDIKSLEDVSAEIKKECGCDVDPDQDQIAEYQRAWIERAIKEKPELEAYLKPYAGEHACRLANPSQFDRFARKNCAQKSDGKCIDVIYGIKGGKSQIQALRYKKDIWTAAAAKKHCTSRKGIAFEPAKEQDVPEAKTVINNVTIHGADGILTELTNAVKDLTVNVKDLLSAIPKPDAPNAATGAGGAPEKRDYNLNLKPLKLS